jgi:hypothetical protein
LFVRFSYKRDSIGGEGGLNADAFLKEAYLQQDREALIIIRQMAANNQLAVNSGH